MWVLFLEIACGFCLFVGTVWWTMQACIDSEDDLQPSLKSKDEEISSVSLDPQETKEQ